MVSDVCSSLFMLMLLMIALVVGCLLFVVGYDESYNNHGHGGCFWFKYQQL